MNALKQAMSTADADDQMERIERELDAALELDGEKLRAETGEDHGPWPLDAPKDGPAEDFDNGNITEPPAVPAPEYSLTTVSNLTIASFLRGSMNVMLSELTDRKAAVELRIGDAREAHKRAIEGANAVLEAELSAANAELEQLKIAKESAELAVERLNKA